MRSVTVVSADREVEDRLLELFHDQLAIRRVWSEEWHDPGIAVREICAANPSVVVLAGLTEDDATVLAAAIDRRDPGIGVLVMVDERSQDGVVNLLRAGARDVLPITAPGEELQSAVDDVLALVAERQRSLRERGNGPPRRVIVVVGPKGGTGKTTVSTNLATGAAKRYPGNVLLIDLDTQFGDVPSALGLQPEHSIADAVSVGLNERTALKVFLSVHDSGLMVLPSPDSLADAADLRDDDIKRTVAAFIEEFPMVVIDTAAGIDEPTLVAMEFATDVIFVSTPDVPAIRAVKKQIEALNQIGMGAPRRHLVINRADARVGLSSEEIQETIGLNADFLIPGSRQFPITTNEGIPLIISDRRDKAQRSLGEMVDFFAPEAQKSNGKGLLGLLRR